MELCSEALGLEPTGVRIDGEILTKIGHEGIPKVLDAAKQRFVL